MTETSARAAPRLGADGRPWPSVAEALAVWTRVAMETDDEGEIEVWTPIGPIEDLPSAASITLEMKAGT